jgi:Fe2+ or Zn2+ uptake regulation protein
MITGVTVTTTETELHRRVESALTAVTQQYTPNRRAVIDALAAAGAPLTLPAILAASAGGLAQSSTYRSLAVLVDAGVVRRLVHGGDHAHYELAEHLTEHHHHLICDRCGTVVDVTLPARVESAMDRSFAEVASASGFEATWHAVDIYGLCDSCR